MRKIVEAAKGPQHIDAGGLALLHKDLDGAYTTLVLYDPAQLYNFVVDLINDSLTAREPIALRMMLSHAGLYPKRYNIHGTILGGISTVRPNNCGGAHVVLLVHSRRGWGPLLYDAAMFMSKRGLTSHRTSVSPAAQKIWKYYFDHRDDVEKRPLQGRCKKFPKSLDFLNYAYHINSAPADYSRAKSRHTKLLNDILDLNEYNDKGKNITLDDVESLIAQTYMNAFQYN